MAAGLGFKTFTTGEVLTAADVNGYLMQGINVFASSAARAAAITSPQEGQYSFLKDTNALEYYDGAAWVGAPVGDITAVTAGKGLTGGGSSGDVTVSLATTAKGDLVAGSGASTAAVLTVGNNGEQIVADSSTSTGLRYQSNFAAGKNAIINGAFNVWQRGTSFALTVSTTYIADRWRTYRDGTGATLTASQQTFSPGTAPVAGYEGTYFLRFAQTVAGTGGSYNVFTQPIEDVRVFAGQTVTLSFWAKADASRSLGTNVIQNFGTGGSSAVYTSGTTASLTTSWQRFTTTVANPSIAGKTIGTNSLLDIRLDMPVNTTFTIDIWGVQLEASNTATAFQTATGTLQGELAACQRYFQKSYDQATAPATANQISGMVFAPWAANVGNGSPFAWTKLHQTMRTTPTLTIYSYGGTSTRVSDNNNTDLAANSGTITRSGESGFGLYNNSGATINTGNNGFLFHWTGSAEL